MSYSDIYQYHSKYACGTIQAQQQASVFPETVVDRTPGDKDDIVAPEGATTACLEVWGAGGAGGLRGGAPPLNGPGGGGGGGGYAKSITSTSGGDVFPYGFTTTTFVENSDKSISASATPGNTGFSPNTTFPNPGMGGVGTGNTEFKTGGNGASPMTGSAGGGGGGGAGSGGDGGDGGISTGGTGANGVDGSAGGDGGAGGADMTTGSNGNAWGGGGGGDGENATGMVSSAGGQGHVRVTFT